MSAGTCHSVLDQNPITLVRRKHRGRSLFEGMKVAATLAMVFGLIALLAFAAIPAKRWEIALISGVVCILCVTFVLFFFRDANPHPPADLDVIVSPSHGIVDYIDTTPETHFLNEPAHRISIYLSLLNVHVQHAPVSGSVEMLKHFPGRWSRAIRRDASLRNEHLLVGLSFGAGRMMALRLISGIWVRRIVPWITHGERVVHGERIGLIRFGSRVDVFLPLNAQVSVKPGDRVRGGETILARFPEQLEH